MFMLLLTCKKEDISEAIEKHRCTNGNYQTTSDHSVTTHAQKSMGSDVMYARTLKESASVIVRTLHRLLKLVATKQGE